MSSGYIPAKDDPNSDESMRALREAAFENSRFREMLAEEVARYRPGRPLATGA